ncbi:hypothetical protein IWZ00DRAFT_140738 [Phyllosticta capitalensis]
MLTSQKERKGPSHHRDVSEPITHQKSSPGLKVKPQTHCMAGWLAAGRETSVDETMEPTFPAKSHVQRQRWLHAHDPFRRLEAKTRQPSPIDGQRPGRSSISGLAEKGSARPPACMACSSPTVYGALSLGRHTLLNISPSPPPFPSTPWLARFLQSNGADKPLCPPTVLACASVAAQARQRRFSASCSKTRAPTRQYAPASRPCTPCPCPCHPCSSSLRLLLLPGLPLHLLSFFVLLLFLSLSPAVSPPLFSRRDTCAHPA